MEKNDGFKLDEDVAFLIGDEEQVVKMSEGIIKNSQVRILFGLLVGMEGVGLCYIN